MQSSKAAQLRRAWEDKGNPLCDHPRVEKEYDLGADTGMKFARGAARQRIVAPCEFPP